MNNFTTLVFSFFALMVLTSCSQNKNLKKSLQDYDKVYGYCDNPHRQFTKRDYKICKDTERANAGDPDWEFDPETIQDRLRAMIESEGLVTGASGSYINQDIWNGAMKTVEMYPLKNVDSNGGYIETEWITDIDNIDERCAIKIKILNQELTSTSVQTNLICQTKVDGNWLNKNDDLTTASNQITLTVLKNAREQSALNLNQ